MVRAAWNIGLEETVADLNMRQNARRFWSEVPAEALAALARKPPTRPDACLRSAAQQVISSSSSSLISSLLHSHVNLELCDKINLSNLLLPQAISDPRQSARESSCAFLRLADALVRDSGS